jgi:ribosomal protein L7Ae-like RNA K-turn-binding protein
MQEIVLKVLEISKSERQSLLQIFKEIQKQAKLRKGLKQTYKSVLRNHLKLAVLCQSQNLSNRELLSNITKQIIDRKIPFFYVNSCKSIPFILNKDFKCSCAGLTQVPKKFQNNLTKLYNLIYNAEYQKS